MTKLVTVCGTDCFYLATKYLGDPNQFYRILAQNREALTNSGVVDPVISGVPVEIVIPDDVDSSTDGTPTL